MICPGCNTEIRESSQLTITLTQGTQTRKLVLCGNCHADLVTFDLVGGRRTFKDICLDFDE